MAIYKSFTDSKGTIVSYHRIQEMKLSFAYDAAYLEVSLAQYADEQYRNYEKETPLSDAINVISRKQLILEVTPEEADTEFNRETVYQKIMALPEWEGSVSI